MRLEVSIVKCQKGIVAGHLVGGSSSVSYAKLTRPSEGFHGLYYTEVHASACPAVDMSPLLFSWVFSAPCINR